MIARAFRIAASYASAIAGRIEQSVEPQLFFRDDVESLPPLVPLTLTLDEVGAVKRLVDLFVELDLDGESTILLAISNHVDYVLDEAGVEL